MNDRVEGLATLLVAEDGGGKLLPVERAVGEEDLRAEDLDHLDQTFGPSLHGLTGELVGVDDRDSTLPEVRGDRALSRSNPARQAEEVHPCILRDFAAQAPLSWGVLRLGSGADGR